ncbi:acyltransferase [Methylomonas sp. MO1]|uniref:acyltransferase n=1 Tax=Methylomonas sp. MO1 TaxID=3073619 RepID=UPI0028A3D269|nr:acyltransferase [Methylomonas sp. MO1]MDT4289252.1 acyltransferase [Methylomonas sp. MO1]
MDKKSRLVDIDKAKGLAIFLVVFGHIVATDMPANNEWYAVLKFYIYKFHMPFFMFISGIIMAYTFPVMEGAKGYFKYVFKKLKRLAPGYVLFGCLIYAGKIAFSKIIHVDGLPSDLYTELYNLLLVPSQSAGGSLWFIYVLMEMYIVFPLIIGLCSQKPVLALVAGVIIQFVPATNVFMLDRFCEYFLFFALGVVVVSFYDKYLNVIDKYCYVFFILFFLSFFTVSYFSPLVSKMVIGFFSLPALQALMRSGFLSKTSIWGMLGKYTYSIYLMNTILIGLVKGVLLKFIAWDGHNFLIFAPILLLSGVFGPIFIKKYILGRIPFANSITS